MGLGLDQFHEKLNENAAATCQIRLVLFVLGGGGVRGEGGVAVCALAPILPLLSVSPLLPLGLQLLLLLHVRVRHEAAHHLQTPLGQ